jgi:hypothetical protein
MLPKSHPVYLATMPPTYLAWGCFFKKANRSFRLCVGFAPIFGTVMNPRDLRALIVSPSALIEGASS